MPLTQARVTRRCSVPMQSGINSVLYIIITNTNVTGIIIIMATGSVISCDSGVSNSKNLLIFCFS